jgi:hypothetical protein
MVILFLMGTRKAGRPALPPAKRKPSVSLTLDQSLIDEVNEFLNSLELRPSLSAFFAAAARRELDRLKHGA